MTHSPSFFSKTLRKYFADWQTGLRSFYPWLLGAEKKLNDGVNPPAELVSACNLLGDCKNFQDDCETRITILDEANLSAGKMTNPDYAENNIKVNIELRLRSRSNHVHGRSCEVGGMLSTQQQSAGLED